MFTLRTKKIIRIFAIILLTCFSQYSFAGTTGKIAGKIFDKTTGEPLIGANILIVGTSMGAASDIDGNYFIINIPPGNYEIRASSIGYSSTTVQNVRVSVDQTTNINFQLN